ncbi:putative MFS family arabinose efflux permease [Paenibacillus phyllosphaerae]|uniref:Putative MFS family arabinose efflux permease n=1 Tax=Paenibacillus phyllosphaerae TaxID=274593 RepID=A0A7W5FQ91_9BACL|nr:MFS transporter [Paenibacillus phyllosphaerae]MBB3112992.1 putative MFS family arabinose efflux permease [Paenibacillus phyllosphaerae]
MTTQARPQERRSSLLRNRFVQTVLLSNMMLQLGIWVRNFAVLLFVSEQTNQDPVAISLISVVQFAPIFIFSFIGGTFADRWRPKRTMVWCDLLSSISVFVVLLTLMYQAWEAVYFATFVSAVLSQFSQPSGMKLFKRYVEPEQQQSAMAMLQTLIGVFMVLGPAIGSLIYKGLGIEASLVCTGAAFLLSALVLIRLPKDDREAASAVQKRSFQDDLKDGFRYVMKSKVLLTLGGTFAFVGLASGMANTLGIFVVTEKLSKTEDFVQYMQMANGAAVLVGGVCVAILARKWSPQQLLAVALLADAIGLVGTGFSTSVALTLALQFLMGFFFPIIQVAISTMLLRWTAGDYIGRVNGVIMPMFTGAMVLMMATSGPLLHVFTLETLSIIAGTFMLLGGLLQLSIMKAKSPQLAPSTRSAGVEQ